MSRVEKTMNLMELTREETAALMEISPRTVRRYTDDDGLPSFLVRGTRCYRWKDVRAWERARACSTCDRARPVVIEESREVTTEATEKALLVRAQREMKEIELAKMRKETVSTSDFERALVEVIVPTRLNLLAIASKLRGRIGNEAADMVDAEIKRALRMLAEG